MLAALLREKWSENPTWGYTRIRGALANLGHEVGRNTIKRILKDAGIEPAPERGKRTQWKTFLGEHLRAICAADFFTVEALTMTGLVRYFVFFVIDIKTRQVHVGGIAHQVYGAWVEEVGRNLTDPADGFLKGIRCLIHDRDPVFTKRFADIFGYEVWEAEEAGLNTSEGCADTPARGDCKGNRLGLVQEVDANGRHSELDEHVGVQEVLDADIARRRPAEKLRHRPDHPARVGARRSQVEVKILGGPGPWVQGDRMRPSDQIPDLVRVERSEQLFEIRVRHPCPAPLRSFRDNRKRLRPAAPE